MNAQCYSMTHGERDFHFFFSRLLTQKRGPRQGREQHKEGTQLKWLLPSQHGPAPLHTLLQARDYVTAFISQADEAKSAKPRRYSES
jgi:hypothetical protein